MNVTPSNFYENYYMNYSGTVNKDNVFNNLKQQNAQQKNTKEEKIEIKVEPVEKERNISKEEATMLLYQYQATQVMKNQIETYFDTNTEESEKLDLQDFRDLNKVLNRAELLKYYQEEDRLSIQDEREFQTQLWA